MKKVNFTSVLLGKNQHTAPTRLPNTKPINSSMGPLKMLNTMFPVKREDMKYNSNFVIYNKKQVPVWKIMCTQRDSRNCTLSDVFITRPVTNQMECPLAPLLSQKQVQRTKHTSFTPNITFYCCIRHLNTTQLQTEARSSTERYSLSYFN